MSVNRNAGVVPQTTTSDPDGPIGGFMGDSQDPAGPGRESGGRSTDREPAPSAVGAEPEAPLAQCDLIDSSTRGLGVGGPHPNGSYNLPACSELRGNRSQRSRGRQKKKGGNTSRSKPPMARRLTWSPDHRAPSDESPVITKRPWEKPQRCSATNSDLSSIGRCAI